jgi:hypothetical protein
LDAEVLIDAINAITGTSDLYTSPIPEPFTYIPKDKPAIALPDGSITSPFLTLFGRSARATGMENERINKPVPAQWLHMLNSSQVQRKLEQGPKLKALFDPRRKPSQIVEDLYLTILSRRPTADEVSSAENYVVPFTASTFAPAGKDGKSSPAGKSPAPSKSTKTAPAGKYGKSASAGKFAPPKRREEWIDIAWALINSDEFLYRH